MYIKFVVWKNIYKEFGVWKKRTIRRVEFRVKNITYYLWLIEMVWKCLCPPLFFQCFSFFSFFRRFSYFPYFPLCFFVFFGDLFARMCVRVAARLFMRPKKSTSSGATLYQLPCKICEKPWGTSRCLKIRVSEHRKDVLINDQRNTLVSHRDETGHNFDLKEAKII